MSKFYFFFDSVILALSTPLTHYMIGVQIIVKSAVFLPFELQKWYLDAEPLRCISCGQTVFNYHSVMKFCRNCTDGRMHQRYFKPFPSILTLPPKYDNIPDVECIVFPINRISHGASVPENYFKCVMDMVADFSK